MLEPSSRDLRSAARPADYAQRVEQQIEQYVDIDIHALPEIFHYWSHKYLRPIYEEIFTNPSSISRIYADQFAQAMQRTGNRTLVSLGPGDGALEVEIAVDLRERGVRDFSIELVELSDHLLGRARESANRAGVGDALGLTQTDVNAWRSSRAYAGVMANHSLHHFLELEAIFDAVWQALELDGAFVSLDMIGRNGHQRWPESLVMTQFFWDQLPERYKFHRQLKRLESPWLLDWDCSVEGFEGIRAQDILPLLTERFGFTHFAAWGGLIDVFIDRGFGHNFSPGDPDDCAFIDRVQAANETLLQMGFLKPTQMAAVMVKDKAATCLSARGLTPWRSVRDPERQLLSPNLVAALPAR